jgi:transcriptional regulator with XRE-family HTH domain
MLGDLLRAHRRRHGFSQEDVAERAGLSVRAIRKIESGQTDAPRPATLRLLADAFALEGADRDVFLQSVTGPVRDAFVGRDEELALLRASAAAAAEGAFRIMWIAGEAGAGKSALGRHLSAGLSAAAWTTGWGGVPELPGTPPAWAWADVVSRLGTSAAEAELRSLLGGADGARPPAAAFWLAREVVEFLAGQAAQRPVLIVLDDMHRAGDETLQILRYAFTELTDYPVLVAATFRPSEVSPALETTWAALAGPRVDRIELGGLGPDDVGRLVAAHTGDTPGPDLVRLITARTGGNPLFVGETARLIAAEGPGVAAEVVPANVGSVLRRRVAALPEDAQAVLRTAAVFGLEVDPDVLLLLPSAEADVVLDGLEAGIRAGLLTESPTGPVRFSHVLVRDTIYQDLPRLRRTRLHAEVLTALEAARSSDLALLAHHALAAAGPATARDAALKAAAAAGAATAVQAHQEATSLLTRALALLDAGPADDELRLGLLCVLVSAQGHAGNVVDARLSRRRAIEVAQRLGRPDLLARAYTAYDAPWALRDYGQLDRELVDGVAAARAALPAGDSALRCRLLATEATELECDDPRRTDRASAEAVEVGRRLNDPELTCYALNARYRYVASLSPELWSELDRIGQEQLSLATAGDLRAYETLAHHILCMASLARNDLDVAQRHLDQAVEHATTGQLGLAMSILAMFQGLRSLIAGHFEDAERGYAAVIDRLRAGGSPNVAEIELLAAFCIEHARDDANSRDRMAALARRAQPVYEHLGGAVAEPYTRALIAAGELDRARAVWAPNVPLARDYYWSRWAVLRAENALHLQDSVTVARSYRQLAPWSGHLPGLLHAHVTLGPVDHTLGDLAAALERPVAAKKHYLDARGLAERLGAPHWAARSRRALNQLESGTAEPLVPRQRDRQASNENTNRA